MARRLPALVFIIAVACNALAGVAPHVDGDGGCSASCCRTAREGGDGAALSRLRCLMNCNQPAGHQSISPANAFVELRNRGVAAGIIFKPEPAIARLDARRHLLRETPARAPLTIYLQTGSLLI